MSVSYLMENTCSVVKNNEKRDKDFSGRIYGINADEIKVKIKVYTESCILNPES